MTDDPQTLRNVREALSKSGYVPVVTGDPDDVPTLIEEHRPQLVLLDLVLPGTDGIEVMERILDHADVPIALGELTIDYATRKVTLGGRPVRVTDIEYRLLVELSVNTGQILTYEYLLQRIWQTWGPADSRPLRATVKNLRRKLREDANDPNYIFNEPRVGYRMGMPE